jgi:phosphatidylserine/phosphatidylglycerophosphate/cardiolipin synthase-like enzyme
MNKLELISPDPAEDVFTTPKARRKAVTAFLRSARRRLLLSIFRCDDLQVLHELAQAVARGVEVQVLMTTRARGWSRRLQALAGCLDRMGVQVRRFPGHGMKYHAKYMVADESALIGTCNLTRKSFRRTRDFLFVTRNAGVVGDLADLFERDSSRAAAASTARLIVGPEGSRAWMERLLSSAQTSIRIVDHKLSDRAILAILRDRRRHGVQVEIQGSGSDGLKPHGRLIIVDGAVAVFGSFALSARSLDSRREVAIVIEQPDLIRKLEREFGKAVEPSPAAAVA